MPENLFDIFPGPHSHKGDCATARLQLRMNLLSSTYTHIEVQSYRDNDQKYSAEIAKQTQAGELNIFDLGYAVLDNLETIDNKLAYFLCRLRFGIKVFTKDGRPIDLLKELKRLYRRGICHLDWKVRIGAKKRLPVRIIAQRVPQRVFEQRVKKAKNDRHQDAKHSDEYYQMLAWTVLITNVPKEVWTPAQALRSITRHANRLSNINLGQDCGLFQGKTLLNIKIRHSAYHQLLTHYGTDFATFGITETKTTLVSNPSSRKIHFASNFVKSAQLLRPTRPIICPQCGIPLQDVK